MSSLLRGFAWVLPIVLTAFATATARGDDSKKECVDASTRGQTLRADGKLLAAREELLACAREACPAVIRRHCAEWLTEVDDKTPSFVVRAEDVEGRDVTSVRLTVDGKVIATKLDGRPISLDPGQHVIVIETTGERREQTVLLAEGEKSRLVRIRLQQSSPPASSATSRSPGIPVGSWVLGGVGVVALGTAAYLGIKSSSDYKELEDQCAPRCDASSLRTQLLVADISLGVGVASLGGAVLWWLLSRESPREPTLALKPLPGGALFGVAKSF